VTKSIVFAIRKLSVALLILQLEHIKHSEQNSHFYKILSDVGMKIYINIYHFKK